MIKIKFILAIIISILMLIFQSCVQKAYEKTVVFRLHTENISNINTVGIRGGDKPLVWREDKAMTTVKKDSLYEIAVTYITGYKFTEVKFVINNDFELQNQPNRRVQFSEKDTTIYEATFNVTK
jgi:hypothetical protein